LAEVHLVNSDSVYVVAAARADSRPCWKIVTDQPTTQKLDLDLATAAEEEAFPGAPSVRISPLG
jgi:hypothetical protein